MANLDSIWWTLEQRDKPLVHEGASPRWPRYKQLSGESSALCLRVFALWWWVHLYLLWLLLPPSFNNISPSIPNLPTWVEDQKFSRNPPGLQEPDWDCWDFQLHDVGHGWTTRTLLCNILGYVCFSSHFSSVSSYVGEAFLSIQSQSIVDPFSEILPSCFQHPFCISPSQCKQPCLSTKPSLGPLFLLGTVYLPLFWDQRQLTIHHLVHLLICSFGVCS